MISFMGLMLFRFSIIHVIRKNKDRIYIGNWNTNYYLSQIKSYLFGKK